MGRVFYLSGVFCVWVNHHVRDRFRKKENRRRITFREAVDYDEEEHDLDAFSYQMLCRFLGLIFWGATITLIDWIFN